MESAPHAYEGHLEAYWEQGWEGRVEYAFTRHDRAGLAALVFLARGDLLTIYDPAGGVRWSGAIELVRRGWFSRAPRELTMWNEFTQRGVAYADWIRWFVHRPPLAATLRRPASAAGQR